VLIPKLLVEINYFNIPAAEGGGDIKKQHYYAEKYF